MTTQPTTRTDRSEAWLRQAAEAEEQFPSISVGGLAARLGLYPHDQPNGPRMFGELLNLLRRKAGMSVAQLAEIASVEEVEIERAERNEPVDAMMVSQLAKALHVAEDKLAQLAGIAEPRDQELIVAARRLESRLRSPLNLSPVEESALSEFLTTIGR